MTATLEDTALRLSAPAPERPDDEGAPQLADADRNIDGLCEQWVRWCRSRRLYSPAPQLGNILGKMSGSSTRALQSGGADAHCSPELAAFHVAYLSQPDAIDKRVFQLHYVYRIKPIKRAADALGISRAHYYSVLNDFRRRVHAAAGAIQADNAADLAAMEQRRAAREFVRV